MLNKEGKYLTFSLGSQEYGIDILKIKEIIGMMPIRELPQAPHYIKGVINLRDKVIPVTDLRMKFGMESIEYTDRSCIIVLEFDMDDTAFFIGIAVDSVTEVLDIKAFEIEETPSFGFNINTGHILAIAKTKGGVKILLDIEQVLNIKKHEVLDVLL
ncbi:chemotaxis protein CheW [Desulfobacterales bacterium HSG16]|nr:chemotaxis protein CheW [Desulfobacterales bacterium HSG16]